MMRSHRGVDDNSVGNRREMDQMKFPARKYEVRVADDDDDDDGDDDEGISRGLIQIH